MQKLLKTTAVKYALVAVAASFVFGMLTRLLPVSVSQRDPVWGYGSDSNVYWNIASNFLRTGHFLNSPGDGFAFLAPVHDYTYATQRLPGYPLFLAAVRFVTGAAHPQAWGIQVANLLLVFLNVFFIISIFERDVIKDKFKYPRCHLPISLFLPFLFYSNGINSDFFAATLTVAFVYCFLHPGKLFYLSPLLAAWVVWTRGNTLFFIVAFLLLWAVWQRRNRQAVIKSAVCLAAVAVVYAGWSYRNYELSGSFTYTPFVGRQLQQNFLRKMAGVDPSGRDRFARWNSPEFQHDYFLKLASQSGFYHAEAVIDKEITNDTKYLLIQHPLQAIKIYFRNVGQMSVNEYFLLNSARVQGGVVVRSIVSCLTVLFYILPFLFFLWSLYQSRFFPYAIFSLSAAAYYFFTAAILGDFSRYALPVYFIFLWSILMPLEAKLRTYYEAVYRHSGP